MGVDWGFAGQVGGMGFGMVFFLLIILAIVVWLTAWVINKLSSALKRIKMLMLRKELDNWPERR